MLKILSWKQVLINAIAFWLISKGCGTLSFLNELDLAEPARQHANLGMELPKDGTEIAIGKMFIGTAIASLLGLLVAFLISVIASTQRKWYWINSVLGLLLTVLATRYLPLDRHYLLTLPGGEFSGAWYYIFYGFMMLLAGLFLLWPKKKASQHTGNNKTTPSPNYA